MRDRTGIIWHFVDFLFLFGICVAMLLGGKVTPLLIAVGVIPIPFLMKNLKNLDVSPWPILLPFGLYFSYCIFTLFVFTGIENTTPPPVNPSLELYLVAIAMAFVGLVRGLQIKNLTSMFRRYIPWFLAACFVALTYLMLAEIRIGCRIQGLAPWPFIPALLFSTLSFLALLGWERLHTGERWLRVGILACSIVVTTTYTGSRGVAVGQACAFACLALLSALPRFRGTLPKLKHLACAAVAGIVISVAVGAVTGCGPASRFSSTFSALKTMASTSVAMVWQDKAEEAARNGQPATQEAQSSTQDTQSTAATATATQAIKDPSINIRLDMWTASVEAIKERPWLGHGSLYLHELIGKSFGFEHNHNQYLSWLVTGGVLQLSIGLIFLATPFFVSRNLSLADCAICTVSVSILWGAAMMSDSFFNLKFYSHYFCLLCGFLYALSIDTARKEMA